jgi:hypothetical protein
MPISTFNVTYQAAAKVSLVILNCPAVAVERTELPVINFQVRYRVFSYLLLNSSQ